MGLRNGRNLGNTALNVRGRLQEHFNNSDSIQRLRFDVLDVINGCGKGSLGDADDPVAHVLGYQTVEIPNDADDGNVDVRKNIRRGAKDRKRPHDQDEYGHNHEGVWPAQCKSNDPHRIFLVY